MWEMIDIRTINEGMTHAKSDVKYRFRVAHGDVESRLCRL